MKYSIAIIFMLFSFQASAADRSSCVLPVADSETGSAPTLEGQIIDITKHGIKIRNKTKKDFIVSLNSKTKIFTIYGGFVASNELAVGQNVEIWANECKLENINNKAASVIRLESTDVNTQ